MIEVKICRQCNMAQSLKNFYRCDKNKDGYRNICIDCWKQNNLNRRKKKKEELGEVEFLTREATKKRDQRYARRNR